MTVDLVVPTVETSIRPGRADLRLVTATVRVFLLRFASNPILMIRAPRGEHAV